MCSVCECVYLSVLAHNDSMIQIGSQDNKLTYQCSHYIVVLVYYVYK